MGKIESVMEGRDGKIRGATIKVITRGKPTYLNRPLTRLYPLEVSEVKPYASNNTDNFQEGRNCKRETHQESCLRSRLLAEIA